MTKSKPVTELRSAYWWTCDNCGRDQFERAVAVTMTMDDYEKALEAFGMSSADAGELHLAPSEVTCRHCQSVYGTEMLGEELSTEDDEPDSED